MRLLIALVLALFATGAQADEIVIEGTITGADHQSYRELPFAVPAGTARLTVDFAYTGKAAHTVIDLGLFDPERFRGWSGGNKARFTLSETDATPSYLPGPLPAGTWRLILGIPNIRKDQTATYEAHITLARESDVPAVSAFSDAPLRTGPAWYRGDLHMHTAQSDGSCKSQGGKDVPCPLYKTVEAAAARNLDFIAISDHNAISQYNEERALQPLFDHLLLIPGREITTFNGHANVFGPTAFIDFRTDLPTLLRRVEALGGLIAINHPKLPSGEICMGCGWTMPGTDFHRIAAIEIVNGGATALFGAAENPVSGIPFWEDLLNKGTRIAAIGGSDNHNATATQNPVGMPVTAVYAASLSDRAILDAIRAGHVFVDVDGSTTHLLEFTAQSPRGRAMMGDVLKARAGDRIALTVHAAGFAGARVALVEDGKPFASIADPALGSDDARKTTLRGADGKPHWLRADIRDAKGRLLAIGNPIYLAP